MAKSLTISLINAIARDAARTSRVAEVNRKKLLREKAAQFKAAERQRKRAEIEARRQLVQSEREMKQLEKEAKQQYLSARMEETEEKNEAIDNKILDLSRILEHTLDIDDTIYFESLKIKDEYFPFSPPEELTTMVPPPKIQDFLMKVKSMGFLENALGMRGRYQRELHSAEEEYKNALESYEVSEIEKKAKLEQLRKEHDTNREAFQRKAIQRNLEVDELEASYRAGDSSAIIIYNTMVLERSEYPEGFPKEFRIAYASETKEMIIEYELPAIDIIPIFSEFKYNRSKDTVTAKPRKPAEIKYLYQDIITAIPIRTIHEVFEADQGNYLQVVTFNGFLTTSDPATGKDIRPCLISVRSTKDSFIEYNLEKIDKKVCLRNMGAKVSSHPDAVLINYLYLIKILIIHGL